MSTIVTATISVNVLNSSYMPLGVTQLKRALALVIKGDAVIEESDDSRIVRSIGGVNLPFPKVIRLLRFVNVPFTYSEQYFSKRGVLERDSFKCGYCGKAATTHDHILPKSRGGADTWMNAISACVKCNGKKADRTPEEARMPLLFQPTIPMKIYLKSDTPRRKSKKKR